MTAIDDHYTPNYHTYDKPTTTHYFAFANYKDNGIDCGQTTASLLSVAYLFGLPLDLEYPQAATVDVEKSLLLQSLYHNCDPETYHDIHLKLESSGGKHFSHYSFVCRYNNIRKTVIGYTV